MKKTVLTIGVLLFAFLNIKGQKVDGDTIELNHLFEEVNKNFFSRNLDVENSAKRAIHLAVLFKDTVKLADLCRMMGVIQYFNGKHEKALEYYFTALKLYQKQNNGIGEARVYNELGTVYKKNNKLDDALKMFENAFQTALRVHDTANMATAVSNKGIVYEMRDELQDALKQYFKSLELFTEIKDTTGLSYTHENIGGVYLMLKKYDAAERELLISLNFRKIKKLEQATAFSFHYLGELYQQKGDFTKALNMFEQCLKVAEKINFPDLQQRAYYSLAEVNKKNGNFSSAYNYFVKGTAIKDSLFNVERSAQLSEIQTKYEVENKDKQNLLLQQSLDIEAQKVKNKNLYILFISLLSFGLIAGGFLYYKRRQQLSVIQTQLKIQKAEQQQRIRISHDLHDHVGAQLTFVVSNLDIANTEFEHNNFDTRRLKSVTEMSKQAIHTLRETVWALNKESISIESFSDKFKAFTQKMSEFSEKTHIEFLDKIEKNHSLPPNTALHLFRICQEAFNNALKHAGADLITVEISSNNDLLFQFRLKDNGKGFNEEEAMRKGHYGLKNMEHRAKEVGAKYVLKTDVEKGTEILLTIVSENTTYA